MKTVFPLIERIGPSFLRFSLALVIAPAVTGFPLLTLAGEFLLKDVVLAAAAVNVAAMDAARQTSHQRVLQIAS